MYADASPPTLHLKNALYWKLLARDGGEITAFVLKVWRDVFFFTASEEGKALFSTKSIID